MPFLCSQKEFYHGDSSTIMTFAHPNLTKEILSLIFAILLCVHSCSAAEEESCIVSDYKEEGPQPAQQICQICSEMKG